MDNKTEVRMRRKILKWITKDQSGCWLWSGNKSKEGYGRTSFKHQGKMREIAAHRLSFIVFRNRRDLLNDLELYVCHKCDNKHCVSPDHLFVGDWRENSMDDVPRNPKVGKEFMTKITRMYREKHKIHPSVNIKRLKNT